MALELPFISDALFILWFGKAIKECTCTIVAGKKGTVSSLLEESCYIFIVGEWDLYRGEALRYMIMGENANQLSHLLGNNPSSPPPSPPLSYDGNKVCFLNFFPVPLR